MPSDLEEWLASIGLAERVAAFRAQGVRRAQLAELTDADLRQLGLSIGERKRFLRAVLGDSTFQDLGTQMAAERRPLSMMFVDLVGSSRLAEQLAPEDLMELLRRYGDFCAGPIARYGGRITRIVGDGILAYFCFPVANENDPERAVRAALGITRGVGALDVPGGEPLAVRIGIATGTVVVGDLRTAGGTYRHTVVGAAPNLAVRLQQLVPPGGIAISEATHERVRGNFVCAELGSFDLRGMSQPHSAWQVLRETATHGRVPRPRPGLLCGRDAELAALHAAWARAGAGEGGVVLLSGEPGIGKSRLLQAFLQSPQASGATILMEGSSFETDSVLRPAIAWLHRRASDPDGSVLHDWAACAPALTALLGEAPEPVEAGSGALSPERRRATTLAALTRLVLAQAEEQPLRLVMEDLHWFDPTTLELVQRLIANLAGRRVLLLLTMRADFSWEATLPDGTLQLALPRLAESAAAELATAMLSDRSISPALLRAIHRKADGVPLFVEEVVRALAARDDALADPARSGGGDELPDLAIPASVRELLAGRLDRLGEAKQIAQAAAVMGREVSPAVLARVCARQFGTSAEHLDESLDLLVSAGVLGDDQDGQGARAFTHALLRDAAYDSLLRGPRRALHRVTAQALLEVDPQAAQARPELVALHLSEGGDLDQALPHWLAAGRLAVARSALLEATRLLGRGLAALDQLERTAELVERRLEFLALLGPAVMQLKGFGSPEAMRLYSEANLLAQEVTDSARQFPIYFGWWRVSQDVGTRLERAQALLSRARQRRDPELLLQAHHCAWASEFFVGNYARCCEHVTAGLAVYERGDYRHHMHLYGGHDAKVCGHSELALAHWMMGRPLEAARHEALGREWAAGLDHLGSVLHDIEGRLYRHAWRQDARSTAEEAQALMRLADQHGMADLRAKAMIFLGWATARRGDAASGRGLLEEGWARQRAIGTNEDFPVYVTLLAETLLAAGEPERAASELGAAEADFDRTGLWFWRSEVRRMQGLALLQAAPGQGGGAGEAARGAFAESLALATEQGAAMLALRTATTWAAAEPDPEALARVRACLAAVAEDDGGADQSAARRLLERYGMDQALAPAR